MCKNWLERKIKGLSEWKASYPHPHPIDTIMTLDHWYCTYIVSFLSFAMDKDNPQWSCAHCRACSEAQIVCSHPLHWWLGPHCTAVSTGHAHAGSLLQNHQRPWGRTHSNVCLWDMGTLHNVLCVYYAWSTDIRTDIRVGSTNVWICFVVLGSYWKGVAVIRAQVQPGTACRVTSEENEWSLVQ